MYLIINDELHEVDTKSNDINGDTRLVDFIRNTANLKGTKFMCREGGCGACAVTVFTKDPISGVETARSVNSCLVPILSCHGWTVKTIESLGNSQNGYHPIQEEMVKNSATQCGFCSPGFVMSMYGLTQSNENGMTAQQIEDNFDGNLCRCTGYRPIMDAMKTFALDGPKSCADIEEIWKGCSNKKNCSNSSACIGDICPTKLKVGLQNGQTWVKVFDLYSAFETLNQFEIANKKIRIVAGNSGTGIFKNDGPYDAFLDVNEISKLRETKIEQDKIILGAGNTLAFTIDFFHSVCSKLPGFEFTEQMSLHIKRIANMLVRNVATLAGNLMLKHDHPSFPSDIFLLFETIGAKINIASSLLKMESYSMIEFLFVDMKGKLILSLEIPQRTGYTFRSFKITKRHENAHAYVNAGFLFKIDPSQNFKVLEQPSIVFGGISPNFNHADEVEKTLNGVQLGNLSTLQKLMESLQDSIQPDFHLPDASPQYRKKLTVNLLYKFILGVLGKKVSDVHISGGENLPRLLTSGQQTFHNDTTESALYKPVPKIEAAQQVSGEAEYVDDIPVIPGELFGAFLLSTVANANLESIDPFEALKLPGVVKFIQAKDIPGRNHNLGFSGRVENEPIFVADKVSHAGQALGLLIAKNRALAFDAVKLIKVNYAQIEKPILSIEQAIEKAKKEGTFEKIYLPVIKSKDGQSKIPAHKIIGEFNMGSQAHVQMETQITLCHPTEDGLKVFSATQWTDLTQNVIATALNIPHNKVHVEVRRLGGAYGCKISRASGVAAACALGSHLTRKPVRVALSFEDNMALIGKRFPHKVNYEVGFNEDGVIEMLNLKDICETGAFSNEDTTYDTLTMLQNCYRAIGWELTPGMVKSNTPPNTWVRAPGSIKGVAIMELIMEHVAHYLKKEPVEVRRVNLIQDGDAMVIPGPYEVFKGPNLIPELWTEMERTGDVTKRMEAVREFNKNNRWRKRGMAMCPMRYPQQYYTARYGAQIAIYHVDGTVAVSHGGIEMGQGINTKVAQIVAHELGIDLNKIQVRPTDSFISANNSLTGGARTSELVAFAASMAAKELRKRIDDLQKEKNLDKPTWEQLIAACYNANVNLSAAHLYTPKDIPKPYDIWGLNCVEVEIDCLTGEFKIARSDVMADAGTSLSPLVDIGQVEGAYIMGMGYFTKEKLIYDETTGQLLTKNTWDYKVPFVKCIPEDFRVSFVGQRPNPLGALGTKATGEAPICLTVTILLALRNAIGAARHDVGHDEWFQIDAPVTPETIVELCLTHPSQFSY